MINAMRRSSFVAATAFVLVAPVTGAQSVAGAPNSSRPVLEQQFRERVAKLAQARIGLTDAQMSQLAQSNARFAPQLSQLATQERETRRQLRVELTAQQPNQQHVSDLLDATLRLQKQRIAVVETEQKDLARFMTPVQRARYIALQQQLRRRAQELSGGRGGQRPGINRIR
jgi:Spy/CpxP family protein refolding chaperone